jgi:hypothetical protein
MECEPKPKKQKNIVLMGIGFLIILVSIWVFLPSWPLTLLNLNEEIKIDKEISSRYLSEIKPEGDQKILWAVNNVSNLNSSMKKLNSILGWEMQDWVNPRWGVSSVTCYDPACRYFFFNNDKTKMRADLMFPPRFGTIYFPNDPAWIAYHKTGACQEISVLFAETANRAGFQTQTVYWISHQWPEVNINGEWWYYDPVCAYEKYQLNMTKSSMWFNKTKNFRTNCYGEAVMVFDTKIWYDFTPTYRYYF